MKPTRIFQIWKYCTWGNWRPGSWVGHVPRRLLRGYSLAAPMSAPVDKSDEPSES